MNKIWQELIQHQRLFNQISLRELFAANPQRFEQFSLQSADLLLDYSKNLITAETIGLFNALAQTADLSQKIENLFNGHKVNPTEDRPALHMALRYRDDSPVYIDEQDIMPAIRRVNDKMAAFCQQIQQGLWLGYSGKAITDIVNIGIGGSDLGPVMVTEALTPYHLPSLRCHFVSNLDPNHIEQTLKQLNPETTLFIIASKSFTTPETLLNAEIAKSWLLQASKQNYQSIQQHFLAVSANAAAAAAWGIHNDCHFALWEWVGGRYSVWSAVGLPIALAVGMENFQALLAGASAMDEHFRSAPLTQNMPVLMAFLGIWYHNFFDAQTYAILPYAQNLQRLPAYLQQLDMESNGKSVRTNGESVTYTTGPIIWGGAGSNSQHAFHQLLHQGTHLIPVDFIVAASSHSANDQQQALLYANCLSQSRALMAGKTLAEVMQELSKTQSTTNKLLAKHQVLPGNRPSNTLVLTKLSPYNLGALLALYEHKTFVQSVIWDINPFDQWGIHLGKQLAQPILESIKQQTAHKLDYDPSTAGLINYYQKQVC